MQSRTRTERPEPHDSDRAEHPGRTCVTRCRFPDDLEYPASAHGRPTRWSRRRTYTWTWRSPLPGGLSRGESRPPLPPTPVSEAQEPGIPPDPRERTAARPCFTFASPPRIREPPTTRVAIPGPREALIPRSRWGAPTAVVKQWMDCGEGGRTATDLACLVDIPVDNVRQGWCAFTAPQSRRLSRLQAPRPGSTPSPGRVICTPHCRYVASPRPGAASTAGTRPCADQALAGNT